MRPAFLFLASLATGPAPAAPAVDWSRVERVEVRLSSFAYAPNPIRLKAGRPVVLHLVNVAGGGHDFTAREFFAAADVRPGDRGAIMRGKVEVGGHRSRDVALVPRAGHYPLKCTHMLHKALGMKGDIVVS